MKSKPYTLMDRLIFGTFLLNIISYILVVLLQVASYYAYIVPATFGSTLYILVYVIAPLHVICTFLLFLITLVFWKKFASHIWQLLPFVFGVCASIVPIGFSFVFEVLLSILAVVVGVIALGKWKKSREILVG